MPDSTGTNSAAGAATTGFPTIPWKYTEYVISKFDITVKQELVSLKGPQIGNMYLEKDFDEDFLPIFMVQLIIPDDLYYKIRQNPKETEFIIIIQSQVDDNGEKTDKATYIQDVFIPMGVDSTPFINENEYEKIKEGTSTGEGVAITDLRTPRTFILVKKGDYWSTKSIYNTVLPSVTMTDAVALPLSASGEYNVLMSAMDNTNVYNEVILLPIPLVSQLQYLDSVFGFYNCGAQIFFDIGTVYVLKNCAKCTAFRPNEIYNIFICVYESGSGGGIARGSYSDILGRTGYIATGVDQFQMSDLTNGSGQYVGLNNMIINSDGTVQVNQLDLLAGSNIITTTTHNPYFQNEMKIRYQEMTGIVTIETSNLDLSILTPNKCFKIISNSSKVSAQVNAPFRLSRVFTTFVKQGEIYDPITSITLKKTES